MKSGIYQIKNLNNGKIYIGSSLNIIRRKYYHFYLLRNNKHPNKILQNSFNKHTEQNFEFTILQFCDKENLLRTEQSYIDNLKPKFNLRLTAGSNLGHKFIRTPEQREKYKLIHKQAVTESTRARMREYKHALGKTRSIDTKNKMSKAAKKPILQLTKSLDLIAEWPSAKDAALSLGICRTALSLCAIGRNKTAYGFVWKFK